MMTPDTHQCLFHNHVFYQWELVVLIPLLRHTLKLETHLTHSILRVESRSWKKNFKMMTPNGYLF